MAYNPLTAGAKTADEIVDLVHATQEKLIKRGALTNLMTDTTKFVGYTELLKRKQVKFQGGIDWRFDVIMDHNHTARHVGLYETDTANHVDALVKGVVSPRFTDASYVFDVHEPELQSGSAERIVEFVREKYMQAQQSAVELCETDIWGTPEYADDKKTPYGIKFWITRQSNADAQTNALGGFDGKDPSLKTSASVSTPKTVARAGISSATYSRWANWAAQYAAVTKADLVAKMRKAARKIKFVSPIQMVPAPTLSSGTGIYCGDNTLTALEDILEAQNMNLGNDLASKDGKCVFKGAPIIYVPALDDDAGEPIYMLDWSTMGFGVTAGWFEKTSSPIIVPNMHNVRQVFLDSGWNMVATNLRNQAVISKAEG